MNLGTAQRKRYSQAYKDGPRQTAFDAMAKKTVLKQVLKYAPIHSENLAAAMYHDEKALVIDEETGEVLANGVELAEEEPTPEELAEAAEAAEAIEKDEGETQEANTKS